MMSEGQNAVHFEISLVRIICCVHVRTPVRIMVHVCVVSGGTATIHARWYMERSACSGTVAMRV